MWTSFVGLITSRLAGPILGVLLLASVVGNGYQFFHDRGVIGDLTAANTQLTADNAALTHDNATLRVNQATLITTLTTQNNAVDGLKSAGDVAAANAKAAQATAEAAAAIVRASNVGKLEQAKPGADLCISASHLITDTLAGEHGK